MQPAGIRNCDTRNCDKRRQVGIDQRWRSIAESGAARNHSARRVRSIRPIPAQPIAERPPDDQRSGQSHGHLGFPGLPFGGGLSLSRPCSQVSDVVERPPQICCCPSTAATPGREMARSGLRRCRRFHRPPRTVPLPGTPCVLIIAVLVGILATGPVGGPPVLLPVHS